MISNKKTTAKITSPKYFIGSILSPATFINNPAVTIVVNTKTSAAIIVQSLFL